MMLAAPLLCATDAGGQPYIQKDGRGGDVEWHTVIHVPCICCKRHSRNRHFNYKHAFLGIFAMNYVGAVCCFAISTALLYAFYEFLTQQFKCRRGIFIFIAAGALTQLPIQLF
jgi:hypothetical protein